MNINKLTFGLQRIIFPMILLIAGFMNATWTEFVSVEGKFRILTPGELTHKVNQIDTPLGAMDYNTYIFQTNDKEADNLVYMVSYCDYPDHSISSDSLELVKEFFETTVNSAAESVKGELRYATDIQIKNYPGKLWRVDYNEGKASIKTKAYLVHQRYYSVQTVTLKNKNLNPSIDKFLDSFNIIE